MVKEKVFPSVPPSEVKRNGWKIHSARFEFEEETQESVSTSTTYPSNSSTQGAANVETSRNSRTDQEIYDDREDFTKRKVSKVIFGSEDVRYKNKEGRHHVEIVSVTTEEEENDNTSTSDFQVYQIPSVESSARLPVRNKETDILVKRVREVLWSSPSQPPDILTPRELFYIKKEGDAFEEAVTKLLGSKEIGVSAMLEESQYLARDGVLKLLSVSTADQVFIFDILAMGQNAFKWGLADVIKDPDCLKVTHDCREMSDILHHQYGLELVNNFDTLAAHTAFAASLTEQRITRTKPFFSAVRDYLGVTSKYLHIPKKFQSQRDTVLEGEELLMAASRDSMYLLELANILRTGLDEAVKRATQCIMESTSSLDEEQARDMLSTFTASTNIAETFHN